MREMTEDELFELLTNDKRNESHDDVINDDTDINDYDEDGNPIKWYELHDDELPRIASVIKKYKEIYTDELLRNLFTRNDINRLNDYMSTHDIDDEHLKDVFESCKCWIRSQMSYDRGRPTCDLFIQDICHKQHALFDELSKLYDEHK